jgi:hypothetical protein
MNTDIQKAILKARHMTIVTINKGIENRCAAFTSPLDSDPSAKVLPSANFLNNAFGCKACLMTQTPNRATKNTNKPNIHSR